MGPRCRVCHAAWLLRQNLRSYGIRLGPREAAALEAAIVGLGHSVFRLATLDLATAEACYGVAPPEGGAAEGPAGPPAQDP
eukprot:11510853-Alexandrium_andersonii.AAC.1